MGKKRGRRKDMRTVVLKANMKKFMKGIMLKQTACQNHIKALTAKVSQCKAEMIQQGRLARKIVNSVSKNGEKFHSYDVKTGRMVLRKGK